MSSTACSAAAKEALVSSSFCCTRASTLKSVLLLAAIETPMPPCVPPSTETPPMEERGGLTGGGVGLGVGGVWGVWGVCGVGGVCGVWGLCAVGLGLRGLVLGGLGVLDGSREGGELPTEECCLSRAGAGVGDGGLVMEWSSLDGLGAVGGGAGLGETGGGIFLPSTENRKNKVWLFYKQQLYTFYIFFERTCNSFPVVILGDLPLENIT